MRGLRETAGTGLKREKGAAVLPARMLEFHHVGLVTSAVTVKLTTADDGPWFKNYRTGFVVPHFESSRDFP